MKKYWYFVSYQYTYGGFSGFGNCELPLGIKITSIEDIREIQKAIEDKFNITRVLATNFVLLRTTNQ